MDFFFSYPYLAEIPEVIAFCLGISPAEVAQAVLGNKFKLTEIQSIFSNLKQFLLIVEVILPSLLKQH